MGIFQSIFGEKIANENKTKPFNHKASNEEKLDWFKRTRPWHKVDGKIIKAIIEKFGENPMIEVFVAISMQQNLIPCYYKFNNTEFADMPDVLCSQISQILCTVGAKFLKEQAVLCEDFKSNYKKILQHYGVVMNSLETAIVLDSDAVGAYIHLAVVKGLILRFEDGLKYAQRGLAVVQKIKASGFPEFANKIYATRNAKDDFEEMEEGLIKIISEFKSKIEAQSEAPDISGLHE